MKYFELDKNEKKIIKDFKEGKFRSVRNIKKEISKYRQYAKAVLNKTRNINIRISESDLQKIKALAVEKGVPYQTLVSSLIHQYSSGKARVLV